MHHREQPWYWYDSETVDLTSKQATIPPQRQLNSTTVSHITVSHRLETSAQRTSHMATNNTQT